VISDDEQYHISDLIPKDPVIWGDLEEAREPFKHATYDWWAEALKHPRYPSGRGCQTCGWGGSCLLAVFYDGMVTMVIHELVKVGVIKGLGTTDCPRVDAREVHGDHAYIHPDAMIGPTICDGFREEILP
jgi:hypothetical protein